MEYQLNSGSTNGIEENAEDDGADHHGQHERGHGGGGCLGVGIALLDRLGHADVQQDRVDVRPNNAHLEVGEENTAEAAN